ncbi:GumC family protein [Calothrix sp. 336/3]|uniref:GumC family protein n=1 Tax=Calothrix sp. 336/3 TaxID=1337936 RepID=UPI0004E3C3BC|nr:polysaccharide biosynthesis tyrosine autokinase [Calothrix sp. 336/3]AKG23270.1 capsular biosynthesis protein [Calothrix sp. 336/3]
MIQNSLNPHVNPVNEAAEPGYGQLFAVLLRRFPWFLLVFLTSIAVAGVITKRTDPTYKSTMQLLVEANYQGKTNDGGEESKVLDTTIQIDTATQLELMGSSLLLQEALGAIQKDYPDMTIGELKGSLLLEQIKNKEDNVATKIFKVDYTSNDPTKTQAVLTALKKVYIDYNRKQQDDRLNKGLKVIRGQIKKTSEELTTAENNLQRFRRNQNFIDPETQAKSLEDSLNTIRQERRTTRSQYAESKAKYSSLQQQLNKTPQNALVSSRLSQSTRYQSLLGEIQKTELSLAQERLRFTDETPQVKKLVEQRDSQLALLKQEAGRTLGGQSTEASSVTSSSILNQGQLGQIDLTLASQLVDTQTSMLSLAARDKSLAQREQEINSQLKGFPAILAEYSRLKPQEQLVRERLQSLRKSEQELTQQLAKGGYNWEIVEQPNKGDYVGPNVQQNLLLGAVVGLMLGGVAAFLREASDDSVHSTAELEKQVALPVLGVTPRLLPAKNRESLIKLPFGKPELSSAPWTVQVLQSPLRWESIDLIFKNIELVSSVASSKSLMITSALPDDSKSALALGLAMSAARLHKRVLLIDANLRDPSLHKQLNLPNEQGLSTILANDTNLPDQIGVQSLGSSFIDILTAGPQPADPANLLSSPRMGQLMAAFEENYDLVLIDAPPVLGLVDALLTASSCQSVVMVASIGKVTRTQMSQATTMLSKLNLIGVVANGGGNNSTYVPYAKQHSLALQQAMEK